MYKYRIFNQNDLFDQLFYLYESIILADENNYPYVIIGNLNAIKSDGSLDKISSNIFEKNDAIEKIYDKKIYFENDLDIKIISILYGYRNHTIDLTKNILDKYNTVDGFYFNIDNNMNIIFADPIYGKKKYLYITYKINEDIYTEKIPEQGGFLAKEIDFRTNTKYWPLPEAHLEKAFEKDYLSFISNFATKNIYDDTDIYNKNLFNIKNIIPVLSANDITERLNRTNITYNEYIKYLKNQYQKNFDYSHVDDYTVLICDDNTNEIITLIESVYTNVIKIKKNDGFKNLFKICNLSTKLHGKFFSLAEKNLLRGDSMCLYLNNIIDQNNIVYIYI